MMVAGFWFVLSFIYIFHVPVFGVGIESMVSGFILFIWGLRSTFYSHLLRSKTFYVSFVLVLGMLFLGLVWTSISGFDFQFVSPLVKNVLALFFAAGLVSSGYQVFKERITLAFLWLFLVQIGYIWVGILSPDLTIDLQLYMHGSSYERFSFNYSGQRGLGLAGGLAFGLASSASAFLVFLLLILQKQGPKFDILGPILLLVSIVPLISIGRSSIVGIGLALVFVVTYSSRRLLSIALFLLPMGGFLVYFLQAVNIDNIADLAILGRFLEYGAEPLINYLLMGEVSTTSTTALQGMYFELTSGTLVHGDGVYYNSDGSYYGHTDSGYMRFALFFGLPMSITIYAFYSYFLWTVASVSGNRILVFSLLFTLAFVLQIKGDVVAYGVDLTSILFTFAFHFWAQEKFHWRAKIPIKLVNGIAKV